MKRYRPRPNPGCSYKVQFPSRRMAEEAAAGLAAQPRYQTRSTALHVYRCDYGPHFHIGHKRKVTQ